MKAMKNLSGVRGVFGSIRKPQRSSEDVSPETKLETPEANATRSVRLFCESGGPNNSGEEVLHLPTIVDAAESSPAAARECAQSIRKFLSRENSAKPFVQYNGIMLMRILASNPGPTFTRNLDKKFVETLKELLRFGKDPSVQQILRETLDSFERELVSADENLVPVVDMWKKEQVKMIKVQGQGGVLGPQIANSSRQNNNQNYFARNHSNQRLPNPQELAARIEEAKTSAKLLTQFVQSTPSDELLHNELVREFSDRCQSASRSIQAYMKAENPGPDNDTMLTLIETNELITLAMSKHQRAVLQTRKQFGIGTPSPNSDFGTGITPPPGPPPSSNRSSTAAVAPPPGPPPSSNRSSTAAGTPPPGPPPSSGRIFSLFSRKPAPPVPAPQPTQSPLGLQEQSEDPFQDPVVTTAYRAPFPKDDTPSLTNQFQDRLGVEPYHPGFSQQQSHSQRKETEVSPDADEQDDVYEAEPTPKAPIYRY